jgi:molybdopterin converting factor small subunit
VAKVLFFGRLRDKSGVAGREVGLERPVPLAAFRRLAAAGDRDLEAALAAPSTLIAVNARLALSLETCLVAPGDEVAFMPPFSGG